MKKYGNRIDIDKNVFTEERIIDLMKGFIGVVCDVLDSEEARKDDKENTAILRWGFQIEEKDECGIE